MTQFWVSRILFKKNYIMKFLILTHVHVWAKLLEYVVILHEIFISLYLFGTHSISHLWFFSICNIQKHYNWMLCCKKGISPRVFLWTDPLLAAQHSIAITPLSKCKRNAMWTAWNFNLRIYESLCIANYHSPSISIIYLNGNYAYLIAYVGIGYVCVLAVRNTYYTEVKPHN